MCNGYFIKIETRIHTTLSKSLFYSLKCIKNETLILKKMSEKISIFSFRVSVNDQSLKMGNVFVCDRRISLIKPNSIEVSS